MFPLRLYTVSQTPMFQSVTVCSWCCLNYFIRSSSSFQVQYNYGLPGKGKSKSLKLSASSLPAIKGEVLFGLHPTILALTANKRKAFHCVFVDSKFRDKENRDSETEQIFDLASKRSVPMQHMPKNILDQLAGNRPHQGVCMDVEQLPVPEWDCQSSFTSQKPHSSTTPSSELLWLLLHNVQDPMNCGAILRTAHYLGVDQVVLPSSDSCRLGPVVSKASAGALELINLMKLPKSMSEVEFCQRWRTQGGRVVGTGVSQPGGDRSVLLENFAVTCPTLLLLGNEGSGLGTDLEACCDAILNIPGHEPSDQSGRIKCLNVSVAAGILLHWIKASSFIRRPV